MQPSEDSLQSEYLILQAQFEKALNDWDHGLAKILWDQTNKMFAKAFEARDKADEIFARNPRVGSDQWFEWMKCTLEVQMYTELARSIAGIIEQVPSIHDAIK